MPYYLDSDDRDLLKKLLHNHHCSVCGAKLEALYDLDKHLPYLQCKDHPEHDGIEREASRYEKDGLSSLNIPTKREILEKEFGKEMTTQLEKYQGGGALTKEGAMEVLKLVYPKVPEIEIIRTAVLCRDFGLHPLMKEVYIIPFGTGDKRTWATVLGINANRKMAAASKGAYSFIDDTPRAASQEEVIKQYGLNSEEEKDNIVSICKLKGERGNEVTAFGLWPKNAVPYGMDKGNTKRNMANIRSERKATDMLPGSAIPLRTLDVIDERLGESMINDGAIDRETGEIVGSGSIEEPVISRTPVQPDVHFCEEHNCAYELKTGRGGAIWYAHKAPDGTWCNEAKKKAAASQEEASQPEPEPEQTILKRDPDTLKTLGELYTRAAKFGLSPLDVLSAVKEKHPEITKPEEITDFDDAWKDTASKFAGTIKAYQESIKQ